MTEKNSIQSSQLSVFTLTHSLTTTIKTSTKQKKSKKQLTKSEKKCEVEGGKKTH